MYFMYVFYVNLLCILKTSETFKHLNQGTAAFRSSQVSFLRKNFFEIQYLEKKFEGCYNLNKVLVIKRKIIF